MNNPHKPSYWIKNLELEKHPEGGWFREVYRSEEIIPLSGLPVRFTGARNFCTSIYFLLEAGQISAFHRIKSDEMWHFYNGNVLRVYILLEDGTLKVEKLGADLEAQEKFQAVVPAGCWFASEVLDGYALVGCTVAPGLDFMDFEMAKREELAKEYAQHQDLIIRMTYPSK